MQGFVKVCGLDDVPPGKGKIVHVGSREILIYNREGRIFASLEEPTPRIGEPAAGACMHPGSRFDVEQEDSPARTRAHTAAVQVRVREDGVYVAVEEGGGPVSMPNLAY